jgi:uncharacterized protein YlaI
MGKGDFRGDDDRAEAMAWQAGIIEDLRTRIDDVFDLHQRWQNPNNKRYICIECTSHWPCATISRLQRAS